MARADIPIIMVGDIRCGCGGLCDGYAVCPMAATVPECTCGGMPVEVPDRFKDEGRFFLRHARGQRRGRMSCRVFGNLAGSEPHALSPVPD